LEKAWSNS